MGNWISLKPAARQLAAQGDEYEVVVHDHMPLRFGEGAKGGKANSGRDVRLVRVTFDGRLRITDVNAFKNTLVRGLGKAKAYGCGLMTLAPVR